MKRKISLDWKETDINALLMKYLFSMFECKTPEGVDTTLNYAKFMSKVKITPDNYPVFFKLFHSINHWVIDALIGDNNPERMFKAIQPNTYILSECINILGKHKPGEIYSKLLIIIIEMLRVCYENPDVGYRLYPLTTNDVNSIGKYLDENLGRDAQINSKILHILDRIASLNTLGLLPPKTKEIEDIATHANSIRGKFLDPTKNLNEAIPPRILKRGDYREKEVPPSHISKPSKNGKTHKK